MAVETSRSAPCSIKRWTMSVCRPATAHISAVLFVATVAALTSAPRASSSLTTSTLPVSTAVISGVKPLVCARVRVGAGIEQAFDHFRAGVLAGPRKCRHAVVIGGIYMRAGPQQEVDRLEVVLMRGVDKGRHAVRPCSVGVNACVE